MLGDALLVAPILTEQTFQREVYLPQGLWKNLLTDATIEGGKTVTVQANLAQIPVFLNVNSPDATELESIFGGINWTCIKNWK
jgi:alpha-glucosidase (family GH31 glycosyl hydrolase)